LRSLLRTLKKQWKENEIMEAPEKIYLIRNITSSTSLNTTNDSHEKYLHEWYKSREKDMDVEYVRKDAFIERVINFLNYKLDDVVAARLPGTIIPHHIAKQELIEDFIKSMEQ
jgi:hypothetical protein